MSSLTIAACDGGEAPPPIADDGRGGLVSQGLAFTFPDRCGQSFCPVSLGSRGAMMAVGDVDGDGRPDLLLGDMGPRMGELGPLRLLRNAPGGRFEEVTVSSGLAGYGAWAAIFGDLDGDGDQDLVFSGRTLAVGGGFVGSVLVWSNNGAGRFVRRTTMPPAGSEGVPLGLDLGDTDRDGRTDIVVGYAGTDRDGDYRVQVLENRLSGFRVRSFAREDVGFTWITLLTDFDNDLRPDLLVGRDSFSPTVAETPPSGACLVPTSLVPADWGNSAYRFTGTSGVLQFAPALMPPTYMTREVTPMAITAGDVNSDGALDYYIGAGSPLLLVSRPGGGLYDATREYGLDVQFGDGMLWGILARDLDRDGKLDFLETHGVVGTELTTTPNRVMLGVRDGPFRAATGTGFELPGLWNALAAGDFDGDGDDDFVVGAQSIYPRECALPPASGALLRNDWPTGDRHALRVRLHGTVSNPDGLGARVYALLPEGIVTREVSRSATTMASGDLPVELGVSTHARVPRVRIFWPSGLVQELLDVPTDRLLELTEPQWLQSSPVPGNARARHVNVQRLGLDGAPLDDAAPLEWSLVGDAAWDGPARYGPTPGHWQRTLRGSGEVVAGVQGGPLHGGVRTMLAAR